MTTKLTYGSYLKLDELLGLQQPVSDGPAHDETLFIVAHQVYELWFKQLLHEIDGLQPELSEGDGPGARSTLRRCIAILRVLVAQIDVLETMTPVRFREFRDQLMSSSGFQSVQFRELEFALGLKTRAVLERVRSEGLGHEGLARRYERPSVWQSFAHFVAGSGHDVPAFVRDGEASESEETTAAWRAQLTTILRSDAPCRELAELLLDVDGLLQQWRHRHVIMVARMIGSRAGTGGSSGVEYLKTTLFRHCFADLWAIRGELLTARAD